MPVSSAANFYVGAGFKPALVPPTGTFRVAHGLGGFETRLYDGCVGAFVREPGQSKRLTHLRASFRAVEGRVDAEKG
ncbi:MAG: hypothetical protein LBG78_04030 [Azoarcus sp.]|nr:hypothetical protein [Azoarcus sp.]